MPHRRKRIANHAGPQHNLCRLQGINGCLVQHRLFSGSNTGLKGVAQRTLARPLLEHDLFYSSRTAAFFTNKEAST